MGLLNKVVEQEINMKTVSKNSEKALSALNKKEEKTKATTKRKAAPTKKKTTLAPKSKPNEVVVATSNKVEIKVKERKEYKAVRIHPSLHEIIKYALRTEKMGHYVENLIIEDLKKRGIITKEIVQQFAALQQQDGRKTRHKK